MRLVSIILIITGIFMKLLYDFLVMRKRLVIIMVFVLYNVNVMKRRAHYGVGGANM